MLKRKVNGGSPNPSADRNEKPVDVLAAYSRGLLSRRETLQQTGLRDSADLLVALGDAGLPLPPSGDIDRQAATFARLWNMG